MDVIDTFGDPGGSRLGDWSARIAHIARFVIPTWGIGWVVVYSELVPRPSDRMRVPLDLFYIAVFLVLVGHTTFGRICLRCMEGMKADAPLRAQRKRTLAFMWIFHKTVNLSVPRYLMTTIPLIWIPSAIVRAVLWGLTGDPHTDGWSRIPSTVIGTVITYSVWPHHKYKPWCPWCKDWGSGGHKETVPDPDPSMTKTSS